MVLSLGGRMHGVGVAQWQVTGESHAEDVQLQQRGTHVDVGAEATGGLLSLR